MNPHFLIFSPHRVGWPPSWCQSASSSSWEPVWTVCSALDTCRGGSCESRRTAWVWRVNRNTEASDSHPVMIRSSFRKRETCVCVCLYVCDWLSGVAWDFTSVPSVNVHMEACVTASNSPDVFVWSEMTKEGRGRSYFLSLTLVKIKRLKWEIVNPAVVSSGKWWWASFLYFICIIIYFTFVWTHKPTSDLQTSFQPVLKKSFKDGGLCFLLVYTTEPLLSWIGSTCVYNIFKIIFCGRLFLHQSFTCSEVCLFFVVIIHCRIKHKCLSAYMNAGNGQINELDWLKKDVISLNDGSSNSSRWFNLCFVFFVFFLNDHRQNIFQLSL